MTNKPTTKGLLTSMLAYTQYSSMVLARIEQALLRMENRAPADAAPLPTADYRGGKPKKAPPRSKYRGCC